MKLTKFIARFKTVMVVCLGMGLLYFVRGAYLPYFFPLYENLTQLTYNQIATIMTMFFVIQAITPPIVGSLQTSRKMAWIISIISLMLFISGFLILFLKPHFLLCLISVLMIGFSLISLKNVLCVIMAEEVAEHDLRKYVGIRTTLMNIGSFVGNISTLTIIALLGAKIHLSFLIIILLLLGCLIYWDLAPKKSAITKINNSKKLDLTSPWKNKDFVAEAILLFAVVVPDGCWGTIIPKYLIDLYHSNSPLAFIYSISLITIFLSSYAINYLLSKKWGKNAASYGKFKWLALLSFLIGLMFFSFSLNKLLLALAVVGIILGEMIITPSFDEVAKRYGGNNGSVGSYYGVLNLSDGFARIVGSSISLYLYGCLKDSDAIQYFWFIIVGIFFCITLISYSIAAFLRRDETEVSKLSSSSSNILS